jgi:hypothetical protein
MVVSSDAGIRVAAREKKGLSRTSVPGVLE